MKKVLERLFEKYPHYVVFALFLILVGGATKVLLHQERTDRALIKATGPSGTLVTARLYRHGEGGYAIAGRSVTRAELHQRFHWENRPDGTLVVYEKVPTSGRNYTLKQIMVRQSQP